MSEKDPCLVKLGQNIRMMREARHLSQEDLALSAELDRTYVGGVERGERNITILSALKLCKALDCDLVDLVDGISAIANK
ncbi:MAG: helix-turn-helix transcriptional regulator [Akkermansiaceae bacterium]|nr:helix-turn-helix transcriptional regulator [Akkermansiaceae bacterium]